MKKLLARLAVVSLLAAGFLSSCSKSEKTSKNLVLTGSSTVAPVATEIGKLFESLHPGVQVNVQMGGSSRGIADARRGLNDIGMVSRPLKKGEHDLQSFTIARDGICLIVHASNSVKALSDEQVVDIYKGKIANWSEVGGADAEITVVNKAEGRGTLELFLHYFKLDNAEIKASVIIGDNEQGIKTVAGNPNAIGYVSIGAADYDATHGVSIKLLPVGGVAATIKNVQNGTFPLSRPLNLVVRTTPEGLIKEFIEFARSDKVHDIVKEQYFVPIEK